MSLRLSAGCLADRFMDFEPFTLPLPKVIKQGRPRRKSSRQITPRATGSEYAEGRVDNRAGRPATFATSPGCADR